MVRLGRSYHSILLRFDHSEYMTLAAMTDISYISVVICFVMFLANDIYGFISWSHMKKRQSAGA